MSNKNNQTKYYVNAAVFYFPIGLYLLKYWVSSHNGKFPLDLDFYRDAYREASIAAKQWQIPISDGILQSNWHRDNWDKIRIGEASLQKIVKFEEIHSGHFFNKLILGRDAKFSLAELDQAVHDQQETPNEELNRLFNHFKQWIAGKRFEHYLQHCKKTKSYIGKHQKEPCNSPHIVACICEWDNSRNELLLSLSLTSTNPPSTTFPWSMYNINL